MWRKISDGHKCLITLLFFTHQNPSVQDDILLEVVMLCGTFSMDEQCAKLLIQSSLPDLLITILRGKQLQHTA